VVDEAALLGVLEHGADAFLGAPQLVGLLLDIPQAGAPGAESIDYRAADFIRETERREDALQRSVPQHVTQPIHGRRGAVSQEGGS